MSIKLPASITRFGGNLKLKTAKNMPEILLVTGIVTGIATVVFACKETVKAADVIDDFKEDMEDIKEAKRIHDNGGVIEITEDGTEFRSDAADDFDEKAYYINKFVAYRNLTWGLMKCYAPALLLGSISIASILTSHGILKKRELAAVATSAAIRQAFDEYRARVRDKVGREVEKEIYYGATENEYEQTYTDESGEEKKRNVRYKIASTGSMYSRIFDETIGDNWHKSGMLNFESLVSDLKFLNYKLMNDGHLFLNDVYKQIGFPISCQGQMAGWIYNPDDPDNTLLKFAGMEDLEFSDQGSIVIRMTNMSDDWKALKNDFERSILVDFINIKDNILEDLPRIDNRVAII